MDFLATTLKKPVDNRPASQFFVFFESLLQTFASKKARELYAPSDPTTPACRLTKVVLLLVTLLVGHSQFPAALGPAALDHIPTVGRRHAIHEAVLVAALALGRLVGTFHLSIKIIALKIRRFTIWVGKGKDFLKRMPNGA